MGQPKFGKKNYDTPSHPWQGDRIKAENEVKAKFGLKNKREIWKAQTRLREIRSQARGLISRTRNPFDEQAAVEAKLLLRRLYRQGYVGEDATLNDVLGMDVERILARRLQSQVYLKGLARTPKQARQFISHGCVLIGERRVTVPAYVVRREEEEAIVIDPRKAIADDDHPIRPKAPGAEALEAQRSQAAPAEGAPATHGGTATPPETSGKPEPQESADKPEGTADAAPSEPEAGAKPEAAPDKPEAGAKPEAAPDKPEAGAKPEAAPDKPEAGAEEKPDAGDAKKEASE